MANRFFKMSCIVCVNEDEAVQQEQRTPEQGPVTLEEIKDYLHKAAIVDWNAEDHSNTVGLQSMELKIEQLIEVPIEKPPIHPYFQ